MSEPHLGLDWRHPEKPKLKKNNDNAASTRKVTHTHAFRINCKKFLRNTRKKVLTIRDTLQIKYIYDIIHNFRASTLINLSFPVFKATYSILP